MESTSTAVIKLFLQVGQLFQTDNEIQTIIQIIFSLSFILYIFYAQRIQTMTMLRQVEGTLRKVKALRDEGRQVSIQTIKEIGKPEKDPTPGVERFMESFLITPTSMDPAGIVDKFEQLLNTREETFEAEVKALAPAASDSEIDTLENLLEAALALNVYYKVIRHYYLLGKKTMNIYVILQIHMVLPLIMREIEAYSAALLAFKQGMPIGDGVGALTAAKLMHGQQWRRIAKETVAAEGSFEGRKILVMKAEGPGGTVGKPGDAIRILLEEHKDEVKAIIMVDAAGKLEGEMNGEVAEGIGAAIGGTGVEKFRIEEAAKDFNVPLYAVAIKQDISAVVAPLEEELFEATDKAVEAVKRIVNEKTKEGETVIVAGIGNTVGIAQ
ncbi:DUF1512 domain-containing protein [Candidatus Bathyarchaeota archaeon]|nr:DUF1512 domain-containing protein [Candidatus Bathyarchaeota archaeon]